MADETVFPGFAAFGRTQRAVLGELTERRRTLGLSQQAVAERMGTTQSAVARLEAGGLDARMSTLERYADALGVELRLGLSEPTHEL